ncbi:hypothetical protein ACS0TY_012706 [Phlomoides rotata]
MIFGIFPRSRLGVCLHSFHAQSGGALCLEGYDDIPKEIPDPEAKKPEDWDDEEDGEWTAPTIPNPEYKGPWKAKTLKMIQISTFFLN